MVSGIPCDAQSSVPWTHDLCVAWRVVSGIPCDAQSSVPWAHDLCVENGEVLNLKRREGLFFKWRLATLVCHGCGKKALRIKLRGGVRAL